MKRIQRGPVRGISFKLQEEERERKDQYVPEISALDVSQTEAGLEVDADTKDLLKSLGVCLIQPGNDARMLIISFTVRFYACHRCRRYPTTNHRAWSSQKLRPSCTILNLRCFVAWWISRKNSTDLVASGRRAGRLCILDQCEIFPKPRCR
jgi:hypothetical protein